MKKLKLIFPLLLILFATACLGGEEVNDQGGVYVDSADECYDDETFDATDSVCYLTCELDGTCEDEGFLSWLGELAGSVGGYSGGGSGSPFITYAVNGNQLGASTLAEAEDDNQADLQENTQKHGEMWDAFTYLIPQENRKEIAEYAVFTDGEGETLAYVEAIPEDSANWRIVMDISDADDKKEFPYTLIHEYGHVLTLNSGQVPYNDEAQTDDAVYEEAATSCSRFFTGEGCANGDSYINSFYQRFWADMANEHSQIDPQDPDALYEFYEQNQDQFVTDYAATNPGEDIAESWTHFVLKEKPTGNSIADQKVLFFYDYPELVALRQKILTRYYSLDRR